YISPVVGILFVLGLISAAYSSADSALTALTTSFTIDILNTKDMDEATLQKVRKRVHLMISAVVVAVILIFNAFNDRSVIDSIFTVAGYTYGPLLGLYAFGMFTRFQTNDKLVPLIALLSPIICLLLSTYSKELFGGYEFGFELVILNGLLTFTGLYFTRRKGVKIPKV
ncbi:MAG TPA: sodium:solute symporter, partial [Tenuifilaceae bacterium]|nr:sodium:solute symporter [Tenuifilaceae bacterium]